MNRPSSEGEKLTDYETLLISIFQNAVSKFISAIELYITKYSFNEAFFFCVIAQEELAKMYLLPITKELGEIEEVINNRNHPYYKHIIKQKVFTHVGRQKRDYKYIEKLKQSVLYVGIDENNKTQFRYVKPEIILEEIKHLALLLAHNYQDITLEKEYGDKFKKGLKFFMDIAYSCAEEKLPELNMLIDQDISNLTKMDHKDMQDEEVKRILTNPYELIRMCKAVFKGDYKTHLKNMSLLSFEELDMYLGEYYKTR